MPEEPRKEPKIIDVETADVQMPQAGEILPAVIYKLGMSTAAEMFGSDAERPENPVIVFFFENAQEGIKGRTPVGYYKRPTVKSKLFKFVRKWGQPRIGANVQIVRDENGYWGLDL
jgi:hypothetical protein